MFEAFSCYHGIKNACVTGSWPQGGFAVLVFLTLTPEFISWYAHVTLNLQQHFWKPHALMISAQKHLSLTFLWRFTQAGVSLGFGICKGSWYMCHKNSFRYVGSWKSRFWTPNHFTSTPYSALNNITPTSIWLGHFECWCLDFHCQEFTPSFQPKSASHLLQKPLLWPYAHSPISSFVIRQNLSTASSVFSRF